MALLHLRHFVFLIPYMLFRLSQKFLSNKSSLIAKDHWISLIQWAFNSVWHFPLNYRTLEGYYETCLFKYSQLKFMKTEWQLEKFNRFTRSWKYTKLYPKMKNFNDFSVNVLQNIYIYSMSLDSVYFSDSISINRCSFLLHFLRLNITLKIKSSNI